MKRLLSLLLILLCGLAQAQIRDRYVVVVSMDGFRHDYTKWYHTPNLDRVAREGVSSVMLPSYPASTFPNHYAMATGLVPDHNGLVNNAFWDSEHNTLYTMGSKEKVNGYFYLGEPIWTTVQRQGLIAGVTYWVGSEYLINGSLPRYYSKYVSYEILSFEKRVERTLDLLKLPEADRPRLVMLYFNEPDHTGHAFGPRHRKTARAVRRVDKMLGLLLKGLEDLPYADKIDLIVLSDHGMTSIRPERCISPSKYLKQEWATRVVTGTPTSIFSTTEACRDSILNALSGVEHLNVWKKEEVPAELNYGTSPRLGDIIVAPDLGWRFTEHPRTLRGGHGYFPAEPDMQTMFRATGPDFLRGTTIPSFRNVSVYELMCYLLGVEPAPNDGSLEELLPALKPSVRPSPAEQPAQ